MADDYGTDISTHVDGDLDPNFRTISGPIVIAEAVARRWNMRRGKMFWDPNAGEDIGDRLNGKFSESQIWALSCALESEAEKDERVSSCAVAIEIVGGKLLRLKAVIDPTVGQSFAFVFDPSKLTVELLKSLYS